MEYYEHCVVINNEQRTERKKNSGAEDFSLYPQKGFFILKIWDPIRSTSEISLYFCTKSIDIVIHADREALLKPEQCNLKENIIDGWMVAEDF
jgi:hypothetical protein